MNSVQKLTLAGFLVALDVVDSAFYIPVGASKCMSVQHMVNVTATMAFRARHGVKTVLATSPIRVLLSTGSLWVFSSNMCDALLTRLLFCYRPQIHTAVIREVEKARVLLGADKIIGVSVQTVEQALLAQRSGCGVLYFHKTGCPGVGLDDS